MNYRTYEDFDLLFECILIDNSKVYYAKLIKSPAGTTRAVFGISQHWDAINWAEFSRTAPFIYTTSTFPVPQFTAQQLGKLLFECVFHGSLYRKLMNSLEKARLKGSGLRIRLGFSQTPELAILPWEYLYAPFPYEFFSLSPTTPIVRHFDLPDPPPN